MFLVAVSVQVGSDAAKDAFQQGFAAYNRGDYAAALKHLQPLAEQGHPDAQLVLGSMYAEGRGVPQDDKEAVRWFRKAAEQGHAEAQNNLGVMYAKGLGVPQDKVLAYALYNLSAATGPSDLSKGTSERRERLMGELTAAELEAGQALTRELMKPGNFAKVLDARQKAAGRLQR